LFGSFDQETLEQITRSIPVMPPPPPPPPPAQQQQPAAAQAPLQQQQQREDRTSKPWRPGGAG
jgi:hypothetical protein